MLIENLLVSSLMVFGTVSLHFFGLAALIALLRAEFARRWREGSALERGAALLLTVFGLVLLQSLEIWAYAILYLALGEIGDLETALYYSATCFTTVGFGDVQISPDRRLIGAIEAANGFLLIGWSGAFLVSVTAKMGLLEARLIRERSGAEDEDRNLP
jgi:hypothetical protein